MRGLNDERGATIAFFALLLTALMGMVVLVVDVGALLVARREMVRAADAGALAAALSCAGREGAPSARSEADNYAQQNRSGATNAQFVTSPSCESASGDVTVEYSTFEDLSFAPVLGLGDSAEVSGRATALWGPTGGARGVIPVVINEGTLQGECNIPNTTAGQKCSFWWDNGLLGDSLWGFLSLSQWDVSSGHHCNSAGGANDLRDWILNGYGEDRLLNKSKTTYTCSMSGHKESVWQALESRVGDELIFPVNDPDTQVPAYPDKADKYNIVGFVKLRITDVYRGDDEAAIGTSSTPASVRACAGMPIDHVFTSADPALDLTAAMDACRTASMGIDPNEPPQVSGGKAGTDYTYDASTDVITWTDFGKQDRPQNASVTLTYDQPAIAGTRGACESDAVPERGSDPNAKCVVTEWAGFSADGIFPGGGEAFGISAIRLTRTK